MARTRLTRKQQARRPLRTALLAVGGVGAAGAAGSALHPQVGVLIAIAAGVALLAALTSRELGLLRQSASRQEALLALQPLLAGEAYPLNPCSISPENLLAVCEEIDARRPQRVLELGSGRSTAVIARQLEQQGADGRLLSLDHDARWCREARDRVTRAGLGEMARVLHAPLIATPELEEPWYDLAALPADAGPFDLLLVDGPPAGNRRPLARLGALPRLADRLADDVVILLDDGLREGEREVVRRWLELDPRFEAHLLRSRKGMWRLDRRPKTTRDQRSATSAPA